MTLTDLMMLNRIARITRKKNSHTWPRPVDRLPPGTERDGHGGRHDHRHGDALGEARGINDDPTDPFGPHVLRHTFATQLIRNGKGYPEGSPRG